MPDYYDQGFTVRRPSWHGKERLLTEFPEDWSIARSLAGLDWEPAEDVIYRLSTVEAGQPVPAGAIPLQPEQFTVTDSGLVVATAGSIMLPLTDHKAILKDDTGEVLSVVNQTWQPIYHREMGELLDAVKQSDRNLKFDSVGSAGGGRRVWAVAMLDEPFTVPGDDTATYPYLVVLNAHDATGACKVMPTSIRVVCWNTWHAADAQGDRTGHQIVIRHIGDTAQKIETAKASIAATREAAKAWEMEATDLASLNFTDPMIATFLDQFIPIPENASERGRNERQARRSMFHAILNGGLTVPEAHSHTAYGVVQAAGEYLDHLRPYRSADTYLARTMFHSDPTKGGVLQLVKEIAADPDLQQRSFAIPDSFLQAD